MAYFVFPVTYPWIVTRDPGNSQVSLIFLRAISIAT